MKKFLSIMCIIAFTLPAVAITEVDEQLQKEQQKYQLKVEKLKRKQELQRLKHPERYTSNPVKETNLTVGIAQKNIKIGTSQDEVAMVLGSPNIVTVDSDGYDTWIYDKVASVTSYNNNGFSVGLGGFGGGAGLGGSGIGGGGGIVHAGYARNSGGVQTNQRTLTIVIKFTNNKVSSFKYHMSSF
ncbi:MAG: hypothetical protein ACI4S3_10680 [Candidatus Gastranaerophilaceae bacterium]